MLKLKKAIVKFLYNNYVGIRTLKLGKYHLTFVKAGPPMFIFFIVYGILKIIQYTIFGLTFLQWWDILLLVLLVIQFIAGFTEIIKNEYENK